MVPHLENFLSGTQPLVPLLGPDRLPALVDGKTSSPPATFGKALVRDDSTSDQVFQH
jgi:hypothetical protein